MLTTMSGAHTTRLSLWNRSAAPLPRSQSSTPALPKGRRLQSATRRRRRRRSNLCGTERSPTCGGRTGGGNRVAQRRKIQVGIRHDVAEDRLGPVAEREPVAPEGCDDPTGTSDPGRRPVEGGTGIPNSDRRARPEVGTDGLVVAVPPPSATTQLWERFHGPTPTSARRLLSVRRLLRGDAPVLPRSLRLAAKTLNASPSDGSSRPSSIVMLGFRSTIIPSSTIVTVGCVVLSYCRSSGSVTRTLP